MGMCTDELVVLMLMTLFGVNIMKSLPNDDMKTTEMRMGEGELFEIFFERYISWFAIMFYCSFFEMTMSEKSHHSTG
jgi:hypothetical protein